MTTWYTADPHFGHANIIRFCDRPWPNAVAMNEGLIERWNSAVAPADTVWLLGDVALSPRNLAPAARLHGRKILVAGNHDACWSGHAHRSRDRDALQAYHAIGFDTVVPEGVVRGHRVGSHTVNLSHLPYAGDHTDRDRYTAQRPADDGLPLLCGHVHDAWQVSGRQINVGVDVWDYAPVHEDRLATVLDALAAAPHRHGRDHAAASHPRKGRRS